jgi:hypothetical protein
MVVTPAGARNDSRDRIFRTLLFAFIVALLIAPAYAMAALSWNLLARPFLRLKRFFEATRSRLGGAHSH